MDTSRLKPRLRRLGCSLLGLIAGNAALLLFMLQNAWRTRAALLYDHMGEPYRQIPLVLDFFRVIAAVSFFGWIVVGIPLVLLLPMRRLVNLHWIFILLIGAALGPLARSFSSCCSATATSGTTSSVPPGGRSSTQSSCPLSRLLHTAF